MTISLHNRIFVIFIFIFAVTSAMAAYKDKVKAEAATNNPNLPILIVYQFTAAPKVDWPYDAKQVKSQMVACLQAEDRNKFDVVATPRSDTGRNYLLQGEITAWHAGSVFGPFGANRERAKVHYWVIDSQGERVFERTDMIREPYLHAMHYRMNGEVFVGDLAHVLAEKVAIRLRNANIP